MSLRRPPLPKPMWVLPAKMPWDSPTPPFLGAFTENKKQRRLGVWPTKSSPDSLARGPVPQALRPRAPRPPRLGAARALFRAPNHTTGSAARPPRDPNVHRLPPKGRAALGSSRDDRTADGWRGPHPAREAGAPLGPPGRLQMMTGVQCGWAQGQGAPGPLRGAASSEGGMAHRPAAEAERS